MSTLEVHNKKRSATRGLAESHTYIDRHLAIETIIDDKLVCHLYSEWLHGVFLSVEE